MKPHITIQFKEWQLVKVTSPFICKNNPQFEQLSITKLELDRGNLNFQRRTDGHFINPVTLQYIEANIKSVSYVVMFIVLTSYSYLQLLGRCTTSPDSRYVS